MIGETVKYNGYKTTLTGATVEAVCTATVIGYDDLFYYTGFRQVFEKGGDCIYWEPEFIEPHMVTRESRQSFHRSRLIGVISDIKIEMNHNLIQPQLF